MTTLTRPTPRNHADRAMLLAALGGDTPILHEPFPIQQGSAATLTSGSVRLVAVPVRAGETITGVAVAVGAAAAGTAPSLIKVGIANPYTNTMLAQSADRSASGDLTSTGIRYIPFSAPWTNNGPDTIVYVLFLIVGTFGTTQPQLVMATPISLSPPSGGIRLWGVAGTGQTDLASNGGGIVSPSSAGNAHWLATY